MIELRACLTADKLAFGEADFFGFGTNDLTQMTMVFLEMILESYRSLQKMSILSSDPIQHIDQEAVN